MLFRAVFWVYCRVKRLSTDVSEVRTASINHFTRQYNPEDSSEHHTRRRENLKSHILFACLFPICHLKEVGIFYETLYEGSLFKSLCSVSHPEEDPVFCFFELILIGLFLNFQVRY
jgi:hypothetical protein